MSDIETAFAKINLALHVRRRRGDGYHDIETLFAFCADGDRVELLAQSPPVRDRLEVGGPFAAGLDGGSGNLVYRAATALRSAFAIGRPWSLRLEKNLPIASGIGGGSADAAATLRLMCRTWGIDPEDPRVARIAGGLGADVPVCLASRAAYGEGRGDTLRFLTSPLAGRPLLLVNPRVPLSTAAVFAAWDGVDRGPLDPADPLDARNDLEKPARALCPAIGDVLDFLGGRSGAGLVRMSGSGATCFALFDDEAARDAAAQAVPEGWWALAARLKD